MIQIEKLILYPNFDLQPREIDFKPGKLNIITGASGTGKSSLINIFRFCLGSSSPDVPIGPISQSVAWYAIVLRIGATHYFIGRPAPTDTVEVTAALLLIEPEFLPDKSALTPNTTAENVREYLGSAIGIEENLNVPGPGQTRRALAAGFVHSLYYCFQGQGEIANPEVLFHHQNREWQSQAIRDTLPYFLGAQRNEDLNKRQQLAELRRDLRIAEQRLSQAEAEQLDFGSRTEALLMEAVDVGLAESLPPDLPSLSSEDAFGVMRSLLSQPVVTAGADDVGGGFEQLQLELGDQRSRAREIADELRGLEGFGRSATNYSDELGEHRSRLSSIGLIPDETAASADCPLCGSELGDSEGTDYEAVLADLAGTSRRLELAARDTPRIEKAREQLLGERQRVLLRIDEINSSLTVLSATNEIAAREREQVNLQSYVRGKIAQFLEVRTATVPDELAGLRRSIARLRDRASSLEEALDPALVRSRLESAIARVNKTLTQLASLLGLEHADQGVRLDPNRLTVVADTLDGPAYLDAGQIGSGLNWVGYHLAVYLALHEFFIENSRPVPRFMLVDQPSQAFFPRDRTTGGDMEELADSDRESTKRLYRLMYDEVSRHDGALQIIALDHADFDEDWFQESVQERWRAGALIPTSWLDALADASVDDDVVNDENPL